MRKLIAVIVISLFCLSTMLVGCTVNQPTGITGGQTTAPTTGSSEIKGADLMAGVKSIVWSKTPAATCPMMPTVSPLIAHDIEPAQITN